MKNFFFKLVYFFTLLPLATLADPNNLTVNCNLNDFGEINDKIEFSLTFNEDGEYIQSSEYDVTFDGVWINLSGRLFLDKNFKNFRVLAEDGSIIGTIIGREKSVRKSKVCSISNSDLVEQIPVSNDKLAREVFVTFSLDSRKEIQKYLTEKNFYNSSIDGLWGTNTSNALLSFFEEASIRFDDLETMNSMLKSIIQPPDNPLIVSAPKRFEVQLIECKVNEGILTLDLNSGAEQATLSLGTNQAVVPIIELVENRIAITIKNENWIFTSDGRLEISSRRKAGYIDTRCDWISSTEMNERREYQANFCQILNNPDFWRRFDFLREKPIDILNVDMSMNKDEIELALGCKGYVCQNVISYGFEKRACKNGNKEIILENDSVVFNCASTNTCGLSSEEIAAELIKVGKILFFETDVYNLDGDLIYTRCSRGSQGDKLCVEDRARYQGWAFFQNVIKLEKGNIGKGAPKFD